MIYVYVDRKLLVDTSFKGMVRQLKNISFDNVSNKKEYMFNVAERVNQLYDQYIEKYRFEGFVRALDKLTIIHLIKCSDCDHFLLNNQLEVYYCQQGITSNMNPFPFNKNRADCPYITNKLIKKATSENNK